MIQTTNIRRIVDRLMRHPMLKDLPFETAVEHAVDFISLVGCPALYDEKTAIVKCANWRGELPCDFEKMLQVRVAPTQTNYDYKYIIGTPCYRESGHSFHMSEKKPNVMIHGQLTYKVQGRVIFTSTKDVDVEIAYMAYAVDDEGYPLLPDNPAFLRGLEDYIKVKWFGILYDQGKLPQAVMDRADKESAWSTGSAISEFALPNLDQAETLFNSFKMLLPRNNEHWKAFFDNGVKGY